ncbi:MAG: hypothetical protein H6686_06340 [Fibrobacteria bacterium]|nr:hypothetical protein [Fibrobacteria bacterium]
MRTARTVSILLLGILIGCDGSSDAPSSNPSASSPTNRTPDAPTDVIASKGEFPDFVEVRWSAPPPPSETDRYAVFRAEGTDAPHDSTRFSKVWERGTDEPGYAGTMWRDSTVGHGIRYVYRVVGYNRKGRSPFSSPDSGWTNGVEPVDSTPGDFPLSLTITGGEYGDMSMDWSAAPDQIVKVYRSADDTTHWTLLAAAATPPFWDSAVEKGRVYWYALTATMDQGIESRRSDVFQRRIPPPGPQGVRSGEVSFNGCSVSWNPVAKASSYTLHADGIEFEMDSPDSLRWGKFGWMEPNSKHRIWVDALVEGQRTFPSDTITVRTLYAPISGLKVDLDTARRILLRWDTLQDAPPRMEATKYVVWASADSGWGTFASLDTLTSTEFADSLPDGLPDRWYRVTAFTSDGHPSAVGEPVRASTQGQSGLPNPPSRIEKDTSVHNGIGLRWNRVQGAKSYRLYRMSAWDLLDTWHWIGSPADTTFTDQTTFDWLGYFYAVSSVGDSGKESRKFHTYRVFVSLGSWEYQDIDLVATVDRGMVELTWHPTPSGLETDYLVSVAEGSASLQQVARTPPGITTWRDTTPHASGDTLTYNVDMVFKIDGVEYRSGARNYGINNNTVQIVVP